MPCTTSVKIRKSDRNIFPESIDRNIDQIIVSFFLIISCKAYTECTCITRNICLISIYIVCMDRIHATDRSRKLFVDDRMLFTECNHKFEKFKQIFILFQHSPVKPGSNIILTVAVVVAEFCIAEFISGKEHRCSAAAHQYSTGVADHAPAKCEHFRIIRVTFHTTVPAPVVVSTIGVVPAICLVVLFIIGIKIIKRKSVMAGKEIDTGIITGIITVIMIIKSSIEISGSGNTPCGIPRMPAVTLQKTSKGISVTAIPFCPAAACRETSYLIKSAGIPCFCNQLDITEDRVICKGTEKRRIVHW